MNTNQQTKTQKESLLQARKEAISDFKGIEHRLQFVASVQGVEYVNDSKATDLESSHYSLETIDNSIVWIVGHDEMQRDFSIVEDLVKNKVRGIISLGEGNKSVFDNLDRKIEMFAEAINMREAVKMAYFYAKPNEVVLLSPGASSFEMYEDFKARGNDFMAEVERIRQIVEEGKRVK